MCRDLEYRPKTSRRCTCLDCSTSSASAWSRRFISFAAALKVNSSSSDALSNLGLALHATGRYDEAVASYRSALRLAPDHPEILYNLGNACLALGRLDEALSSYEDVLTHAPGHVGALVNRGNTLLRFNRPVEAMASYDEALAAMPGHPQILTNRGHALRRLDRPVEALADFEAALAAAPEFAEAHFEAAMTRLTLGDFAAGWKAYEWRWKTGAFARHRRQHRSAAMAGRAADLRQDHSASCRAGIWRHHPVHPLCAVAGGPGREGHLRGSAGIVAAAVGARRRHRHGFRRAAAGLRPALSFAQSSARIRDNGPRRSRPYSLYGCAGGAGVLLAATFAARSAARRVCLVGPAVAQERRQPVDRAGAFRRAVRNPPFHCFSLQSDLRAADSEVLAGLPNLVHLGGDLRDFADTAAIISLLDVVISVDTAVAHLAGALGKPVLILLPHAADFRWMRGRDDSPWYPTAQLVRQPAFGDWDSVIAGRSARNCVESGAVRISLTTSIYCLVRNADSPLRSHS